MQMDIGDLTKGALERLVKQLLTASEQEEKEILKKLDGKNDLADLDEEMHGKPNTPEVEDDDLPKKELADLPKKKVKK
ncbi:MAG: hypothetical protein EBT14_05770 [Betaproteobacteria bacterium]|nr:hypothetical protein [Betaproteobacteria bacterium]